MRLLQVLLRLSATALCLHVTFASSLRNTNKRKLEPVDKDFDVRDFPKLVKDMIKNDEFTDEQKENLASVFDPFKGSSDVTRHPNITRECGEVISRMSADNVRDVMYQLFYLVFEEGSVLGILSKLWVDTQYKYGVEAIKICASCTDFYEEFGGTEGPEQYEDYCGEANYAHNATVSGLLQIPLDANGDYVNGELKGAIWMHWIETRAFFIPSETYPSDPDWGDTVIEDMRNMTLGFEPTTLFSVAVGGITISPDYVGHGEAFDYYKSVGQKRVYQAGSIPLALQAKIVVSEATGGITTLSDDIVVSGYSEGGYPAIGTTAALANVGFNILWTQAGGAPYDGLSDKGILGTYWESRKGTYHEAFMPIWGITYSSIYPDLPNTDQGQDVLSDENKTAVLAWMRTIDGGLDLSKDEIDEKLAGHYGYSIMNPTFDAMIESAKEQNLEYPCDLAVEGETDLICDAIKFNDMTYLVEETKHRMLYCAGADDSFVQRIPSRRASMMNRKLTVFKIPGANHRIAAGVCYLTYWLNFASPFFTLF